MKQVSIPKNQRNKKIETTVNILRYGGAGQIIQFKTVIVKDHFSQMRTRQCRSHNLKPGSTTHSLKGIPEKQTVHYMCWKKSIMY